MAGSDAIIVVEDWISEHYFSTDAKSESFQSEVLKRRKAWDEVDAGVPHPPDQLQPDPGRPRRGVGQARIRGR